MKIHTTHLSMLDEFRFVGQAFRLTRAAAILICATVCGSAAAEAQVAGAAGSSHPSSAVRTGLFTHQDQAYRVVNTAAFATAADVGATAPGAIAQVGLFDDCQSCGSACGGSCDSGFAAGGYAAGGCGSCGTRCGGSCDRSTFLSCGGYKGNACAPCQPYCYTSFEGLYMERDVDENFSLSPDFRRGDFDYEWGGRVTVGSVPDCVHGYEVSFTGVLEWDVAAQVVDPNGNIGTSLRAGLPVAVADLRPFANSNRQVQTYSAEYFSLEANKTLVGWEMAKLLYGARYIDYDEDFDYFGVNTANDTGQLHSAVKNQLFGLQVGLDLLYPICRNGFADFRSRLGGFVDFAESDVQLALNQSNLFANFDEDEELAGVIEIGSGVRYQLGDMLSVRGGVELWYLTGIATATDQFASTTIRPVTGREVRMDDDILITGASFGAELRY